MIWSCSIAALFIRLALYFPPAAHTIEVNEMLTGIRTRADLFRVCWRILSICITCMVVSSAWTADPAALGGTYKYVPEQSSDISKSIDATVANMNFIKRPIARGRLAKTNVPYQKIRLQLDAAAAEITYDDRKPIRMPLDGQSIKWTRDDGEVFDVSARLAGNELVQTYKADDGMRVNSFHVDADGLLRLQVEVSSPQLPQAMKYELVYRPE